MKSYVLISQQGEFCIYYLYIPLALRGNAGLELVCLQAC